MNPARFSLLLSGFLVVAGASSFYPGHCAPVKAKPRAAARPAPQGQAGGASRAAIEAYCGRVWSKVYGKWNLPDGDNHVTIVAQVSSDGSIGDISVTSSPKNGEAEAAAMTALDQSKPLDLLPTGMGAGKLTITFNSKADPHGDSSSGGSVRLDPGTGSNSGGK